MDPPHEQCAPQEDNAAWHGNDYPDEPSDSSEEGPSRRPADFSSDSDFEEAGSSSRRRYFLGPQGFHGRGGGDEDIYDDTAFSDRGAY